MSKIRTISVIVMVVCLTACHEQKQERKLEPIAVKTEMVSTGNHLLDRTYVGEVEEESATAVSFTGSGTLTKVCVDEGQSVRAGQLIAEIDKTQARNMLSAAESQMRQAKDAKERMQLLHDNGSLSEMKWVETLSQVEQAQAQLDMAKKSLADCSIYAPVSGIIGKNVMDAGETVLPSMPVASILNINRVKVNASIPEKEIASFTPHTPTVISVEALGGRNFQGGTITKGVEADGMTHTYNIKININNNDHSLLPGMVCQIKVYGLSNTSQISVPITSVQKNARGEYFVWTVKDGKAHRSVVTIGRASGNRTSIQKGLSKGDEVIIEGYQKLSEGTEVKK